VAVVTTQQNALTSATPGAGGLAGRPSCTVPRHGDTGHARVSADPRGEHASENTSQNRLIGVADLVRQRRPSAAPNRQGGCG